jgi:hypothetical protein
MEDLYVGVKRFNVRQHLASGGRFADDDESCFALQQFTQPLTKHAMVVGEENTNFTAHMRPLFRLI